MGYTKQVAASKCSAVAIRVWRSLVARLNGVQEAVSSTLATRTKRPAQQSWSFFVAYGGAAKGKRTPSAFENRHKTGPPLFVRCEKRRALFLIFGLF